MKFSNCNKKIAFSLLCIFTSSFIFASNNSNSQETVIKQENQLSPEEQKQMEQLFASMQKEQEASVLEAMKNQVREQLQKIEYYLQHLVDTVNNNQIKNIKKQVITEHITNLKLDIAKLKKNIEARFDAEPEMIVFLNFVVKQYVDHLSTLIKSNLKTIPAPKKPRPIKPDSIHLQDLAADIDHNEQSLATLEQDVKNIGLSVFNRMYRKVEYLNKKYHVMPRIGKTVIAGIGAYAMILMIRKELWQDFFGFLEKIPGVQLTKNFWNTCLNLFAKIPYADKITENKWVRSPGQLLYNSFFNLKNKIGEAPLYKNGGNAPVNGDQIILDEENKITKPGELKGGGNILATFGPRGMQLINPGLPTLITWKLFGSYFTKAAMQAGAKLKKMAANIHDKLRGGGIKKIMRGHLEPRFTLKDVIGNDHIKQKLMPIIGYHTEPEIYEQAGIEPQPGIIFAGASSAGKSYLAEAIAGEIIARRKAMGLSEPLNFLALDAGDVMNRDIFENGIQDVINLARMMAPCMLFIDEIDMLKIKRELDAVELAKLLTLMSGVLEDNTRRITIIGATTEPESLDSALINSRRFEIMQLGYPSFEERKEFLMRECQKRAILIEIDYIDKLSRETKGRPYDDLLKIIKVACQNAKMQRSSVTQHHLEQAFDERIRKIQNKDLAIPAQQKRTLAIHQAGHALATILLDTHKELEKVTIKLVEQNIQEQPSWQRFEEQKKDEKGKIKAEYGKVFTHTDHELEMSTRQDLINDCKIALAGHIAEQILLGSCAYTYHDQDQDNALSIAKYLSFEGTLEKLVPKKERTILRENARTLVKQCKEEMIQLLTVQKDKLKKIADALEQKLTLNSDEISLLISSEINEDIA